MRVTFCCTRTLVALFSISRSITCFRTSTTTSSLRKQQQQEQHPHQESYFRHSSNALYSTSVSVTDDEITSYNNKLKDLKVSIVGGGPSGLLVAHRLLNAGATVTLFERRPRPGNVTLESRAYALGVGIRGRTAIQSVDMNLWQAVKRRGFSSERFILHIGPFSIRLRDEGDGKSNTEPSLLLYQSDLCGALTDELEARWKDSGRLRLNFDCGVSELSLQTKSLVHSENKKVVERFDLVIGCDGVNSIVRKQIAADWSDFQSNQELLPGVFKVIQCASMPPLLDPTAVQLVFPKAGSATAFVEPISDGRCCILFAGSNASDILFSGNDGNVTLLEEELSLRYPKLIGMDVHSAAKQLMEQGKPTQASVVTCNTYHYSSVAVLTGDAAHATGGVSGQGVNSALQDAAVLVNSLLNCYDKQSKEESIRSALLQYSQKAVPEGKALYDLSFGPKPATFIGKLRYGLKSARDIAFKGKLGIGELPLQTMLTLSVKSFSDIRRDRDLYYETPFPEQTYWNQSLAELDAKVKTLVA